MSLLVVHIEEYDSISGFKYYIVSYSSFLYVCHTFPPVAYRSAVCGGDVIVVAAQSTC